MYEQPSKHDENSKIDMVVTDLWTKGQDDFHVGRNCNVPRYDPELQEVGLVPYEVEAIDYEDFNDVWQIKLKGVPFLVCYAGDQADFWLLTPQKGALDGE